MDLRSRLEWRAGLVLLPQRIWLDATQRGPGFRFVGSLLDGPAKRSESAICSRFTGAWHYGREGLFLDADAGHGANLGDARLELYPSGMLPGARALACTTPEGTLFYASGFSELRLPLEKAQAPRASIVVLRADTALLQPEEEPAALFSAARAFAVQSLEAGQALSGACNDLPRLMELAHELSSVTSVQLQCPARHLERWTGAGGRIPENVSDDAPMTLRSTGLLSENGLLRLNDSAGRACRWTFRRGCSPAILCDMVRACRPEQVYIFGQFAESWLALLRDVAPAGYLRTVFQQELFPDSRRGADSGLR